MRARSSCHGPSKSARHLRPSPPPHTRLNLPLKLFRMEALMSSAMCSQGEKQAERVSAGKSLAVFLRAWDPPL